MSCRQAIVVVAMALVVCWQPTCACAAETAKSGTERPEGRINAAYVKIKARRMEVVRDYVDALIRLAQECAEKGFREPGTQFIDRALRAVEPLENRRFAAGGEMASERQEAPRTPAMAYAEQIKNRCADLRRQLMRAAPPSGPADPAKRTAPQGSAKGAGAGAANPGKQASGSPSEKEALTDSEKLAKEELKIRAKSMKSVENMANVCLENNLPAHAFEVLLWAIDFDPDNEALRNAVGQVCIQDCEKGFLWGTRYESSLAKKGLVKDEDYGWIKPSDRKELKAGKMRHKDEWVPRAQVEAELQKWENAWVYETEHFEITTNADLREAVRFACDLERFYSFFFRALLDFVDTGNAVQNAKIVFGGGKILGRKLRLNYYRSKDDYDAAVLGNRNITDKELCLNSAGLYLPADRRAYFHRGRSGPDLRTIYHETTHQLFGEALLCTLGPTWLQEGFATFMEDPLLRKDRLIAGARAPLGINERKLRDINGFMRYFGGSDFHRESLRSLNYATAGAVVHFFLLYEGGIYRQGFMNYARWAYRHSDHDTRRLYENLRVTEQQLQEDWEEFNRHPEIFDF